MVFFSNEFFGFSYHYFHFFSKILEEFRVWIAEDTNPNNKKVLFIQRGAPPPAPRRGLRPRSPTRGCALGPASYPHTSSLSPYIPSHLGLAGVVSHLRAYTRYVELYTQNCIKSRMQVGHTSLHTRAIGARASRNTLRPCCIIYYF